MADELSFDWNRANVEHIARHDVMPEECEQALRNEPLDLDYQIVAGEPRWTSFGHTNRLRILMIVWTARGDRVRVVTARSATKPEQEEYFRQKGL